MNAPQSLDTFKFSNFHLQSVFMFPGTEKMQLNKGLSLQFVLSYINNQLSRERMQDAVLARECVILSCQSAAPEQLDRCFTGACEDKPWMFLQLYNLVLKNFYAIKIDFAYSFIGLLEKMLQVAPQHREEMIARAIIPEPIHIPRTQQDTARKDKIEEIKNVYARIAHLEKEASISEVSRANRGMGRSSSLQRD